MTQPTQAPAKLNMGPEVWADIQTAGSDWPTGLERAGILFGSIVGDQAYVAGCAELQNVAADPQHTYEFDPGAQAKAWSRVERWGYEVLGIWHTHPEGPSTPSTTDLEYMQAWLLYPVLYPDLPGDGAAMTVYKLDGAGGYVEVPYEVTPSAPELAAQAAAATQRAKAHG